MRVSSPATISWGIIKKIKNSVDFARQNLYCFNFKLRKVLFSVMEGSLRRRGMHFCSGVANDECLGTGFLEGLFGLQCGLSSIGGLPTQSGLPWDSILPQLQKHGIGSSEGIE